MSVASDPRTPTTPRSPTGSFPELLAVSDATSFGELRDSRIAVSFNDRIVAAACPTVVLALTTLDDPKTLFLPIHALQYINAAPGLADIIPGAATLPETAPDARPPKTLPVIHLQIPSFGAMDVLNRFIYLNEVPVRGQVVRTLSAAGLARAPAPSLDLARSPSTPQQRSTDRGAGSRARTVDAADLPTAHQ